jgi:hypothetical protein
MLGWLVTRTEKETWVKEAKEENNERYRSFLNIWKRREKKPGNIC